MTLSYSGIVNYGKSTLPAVEAWSTNINIVRDPPRAVMTRNVDRVGDTSEILATLASSEDRYCENINYYARGLNPMVSVSYGEAATVGNTSGNGEAYLPYRVMRDGAFRPPVWRQEDLFPLSRLPRNWTTVEPRPFSVDYSRRVMNCGTCETTREVKNDLLKVSCETKKIIAAEPQLTAPQAKYMIKNPLAPGTDTNKSCCRVSTLQDAPDMGLKNNWPMTSVPSTERVFNERAVVFNNVKLDSNHPTASGCTNPNGAIFQYTIPENDVDRILPQRLWMGSYDCRPEMPAMMPTDRQFAKLQKVR